MTTTRDNDIAKLLMDLLKIIRPALPQAADYTAEEKAIMYDQARSVLYDESGTLRPLNPRLPTGMATLVIGALSAMSWGVMILAFETLRGALGG
jgi:hypothetical protein